MSKRAARIASTIFASVLAGATFTTISHIAADAAETCRTEPGDQTPEGKHWYYRVEHSSNRQCWYLRGEGERPAQANPQRSEKAVEPQAETPAPQRSLADAHAEYPWPQPRVQQNTAASTPQGPQAVPADAANAQDAQRPNVLESTTRGSLIGSRWPDPGAASTVTSQATATPEVVAQAQPDQTTPAPPAPPAALVAADASPAKTPASLPTLLMVVAGALALAGLTGSLIFRLGSRRPARSAVRPHRRVAWDTADVARPPPPRQSPLQAPTNPTKMPPWVDPEFARRPELAPGFHEASGHDDHNDRLDKISEILERMSKQPATSVAGSASRERTPTGRPDVRA